MNPFLLTDFWFGAFTLAGAYAILALGIQLNVGFTGLLNLGHSGFMAIGAYAMAVLVLSGTPMIPAIVAAIAITVVLAVLLGLPSLRLPEEYFAIVTVAAASIIIIFAQNLRGVTGGLDGLSGFDGGWVTVRRWILERLEPIGLGDQFALPLLVVTWLVFLVLALLLVWLQRTAWGRTLRAVREDEEAAAALGKNVTLIKLQSLGLSGLTAAVAGILLALNLSVVYPGSFDLDTMFIGTSIMMLGGLGSYFGVSFGAVVVWGILEFSRFAEIGLSSDRTAAIRFLLIGVVLVVMAMYRPQGVFGDEEEMVLRG